MLEFLYAIYFYSHNLDCPIRALGEASMRLINITETPLATGSATITYYGECNSTGPRYSLYVCHRLIAHLYLQPHSC